MGFFFLMYLLYYEPARLTANSATAGPAPRRDTTPLRGKSLRRIQPAQPALHSSAVMYGGATAIDCAGIDVSLFSFPKRLFNFVQMLFSMIESFQMDRHTDCRNPIHPFGGKLFDDTVQFRCLFKR